MNIKKMEKLRDALQHGIKGVAFNMQECINAKSASICGHALLLHRQDNPKKYQDHIDGNMSYFNHARDYLGLNTDVAESILPDDDNPHINRRAAAKAVQNVINGAKTKAEVWAHLEAKA